jgi:hypothetical protein
MKLRTRGNSLRLRLTQGEVEALLTNGQVEEATEFGPDERMVVRLVADDGAGAVRAQFERGHIVVRLPRARATAWGRGSDVGIHAEQPVAPGRALQIAVEKDFACLKPRAGEDDRDAYPNPGTGVCT